MSYIPSYISLYEEGILTKRIEAIRKGIEGCMLCPHKCNVDRTKHRDGKCKSGQRPIVSSFNAHFGEESCLVGRYGSGTIFFTNCNLSCIFCQNYDISHLGSGKEISYKDLANIMLNLQAKGCHNINLVTPTHMVYAILRALPIAIEGGLRIPLVYNSGGYDSIETLHLLDGVIDIYMPDFKFMDYTIAEELSNAKNYPNIAMNSLREMHNQVGDLLIDDRGIAYKGLMVRHLVLPNNIASTDRVISFIANLSKNTYINIMNQYRPAFRARECFDLKRRITLEEYDKAIDVTSSVGLKRLDKNNFFIG
ncbi:MAG: radical SAM protein [Spirochaetota bacterium]|nr:radical SAM protein [Spirochaetota bacterium]